MGASVAEGRTAERVTGVDTIPGHALTEALRDDLGAIVVCECDGWGWAGRDGDRLAAQYVDHLAVATVSA